LTNFTSTNNSLDIVWPDVINKAESENSVELALFVPENLDYFNGHFPDSPILAGVVQLHWAVEYAKQEFNLTHCEVANLEVLKFQVVIVPKQNLVLTLTLKSNDKVLFTYTSERGQHASGRIVFEHSVCESKT
jgi:3-hydroxymyristoyl/3-hydroxydecanoyl-(acyl carrier protein) dehydratase